MGDRGTERVLTGASFSGHERNRMFISQGGEQFVDISGLSGANHPGDARAFAILDFDMDGWQDLAVVNANAPFFQLFRNHMGDGASEAGIVGVRFQGGNREATPSSEWTSRDGYGARVAIDLADRTLVREYRAGEGLAAQNSPTMRVGIGDSDQAMRLTVRWPSGATWDTTAVRAGTVVTAYEDPTTSPTGTPFVLAPYRTAAVEGQRIAARKSSRPPGEVLDVARGSPGQLVLLTTMATWCVPCLDEIPSLDLLRSTFSTEELAIYGVPYDETEDTDTFQAWSELNNPPYEILQSLSDSQINAVRDAAVDLLQQEGLPVAIVTDEYGEILLARWGPPSISEIRRLLDRNGGEQ